MRDIGLRRAGRSSVQEPEVGMFDNLWDGFGFEVSIRVGEDGEGGEKATRDVGVLWEMENGQKCFGRLTRSRRRFPFTEMVQTVNQTNLVALRILASRGGSMRNMSHSERLRLHPKSS